MPDQNPVAAEPAGGSGCLRRSRGARLAVLLLLGLGAYVLMITACQRAILFPRHVLPDVSADPVPAGVERLARPIAGGEVEAWFIRAADHDATRPAPLVVFAHGNGELIDYWPAQLEPYRRRGLSVLLVEYRGYGRSAGKPSEADIVSDYVHFHDQVARRDDVDADRIVLHGRSLGGGVVAQLAARRRPAALILESSFTSVADVARGMFVPRFLVRDPFEVRQVIRQADYPVLILHGSDDTVIPASHARTNHEAAPASRLVLFDHVGHNDPLPARPYWEAINHLLVEAGIIPLQEIDP